MATALPHGVPAEAAVAARDTLEGAVVVAGHLAGPLGAELLGAARGAFTHAMQWAAFVSAALALATAITSTILLRNIAADTQAREDIEPREGLSATPAPECLAPGQ
jgi:DHA2 family multidrug resistance protein-like MFS transporter